MFLYHLVLYRGKLHLDLYDDVKALEHYRALKLGDQAAKKKMVIDQMPPPEMSSKRILFKPLYVESPSSFWIQVFLQNTGVNMCLNSGRFLQL